LKISGSTMAILLSVVIVVRF